MVQQRILHRVYSYKEPGEDYSSRQVVYVEHGVLLGQGEGVITGTLRRVAEAADSGILATNDGLNQHLVEPARSIVSRCLRISTLSPAANDALTNKIAADAVRELGFTVPSADVPSQGRVTYSLSSDMGNPDLSLRQHNITVQSAKMGVMSAMRAHVIPYPGDAAASTQMPGTRGLSGMTPHRGRAYTGNSGSAEDVVGGAVQADRPEPDAGPAQGGPAAPVRSPRGGHLGPAG